MHLYLCHWINKLSTHNFLKVFISFYNYPLTICKKNFHLLMAMGIPTKAHHMLHCLPGFAHITCTVKMGRYGTAGVSTEAESTLSYFIKQFQCFRKFLLFAQGLHTFIRIPLSKIIFLNFQGFF